MKFRLITFLFFVSSYIYSQNFHDTQGKLEISNGGQATYTLPIAMPPSIGDVGPVVNLVYSSGQQSGIAGQGWSINNISAITRIATRVDIDGFKDGVDFDNNDKLALDGQRLLLKSGTYWQDGSVYETEVQSNTKIELKGTGNSIYFIVTNTDGSRTWYGNYNGVNATDATTYYAVRFEDTNTNFIDYVYSRPLGKGLCVSEIKFSGNTISNPIALNKIVFSYDAAARNESAFINGSRIEKAELLTRIEVFTNGSLFRKYQLTHTTDIHGYQRISQLQEFNGSGAAANPVLFDYDETDSGGQEVTTTFNETVDIDEKPDITGDFDGDGRLDFVWGKNVYTKLLQGGNMVTMDNYFEPRLKLAATTLLNNKLQQKQSIVAINESVTGLEFKIFNLQNNQFVNSYNKSVAFDNELYCRDICSEDIIDSQGSYYVIPNCSSVPEVKKSNKYLEGDFNGDGVSEILILGFHEQNTYRPINYLNAKSSQKVPSNNEIESKNVIQQSLIEPDSCEWEYYISQYPTEVRLLDLNQNASTILDTLGYIKISNPSVFGKGERYVMDMNSDGKSDVLVVESDKTYKVLSFKQLDVSPWIQIEIIGQGILDAYTVKKNKRFGDFNGDGKTDIMMPDADDKGCETCTTWHIYYSNPNPNGGSFFTKESVTTTAYRPYTTDDYDTQWHATVYYAMDTNKDGKSDLVKVWMRTFKPCELCYRDLDTEWRAYTYINTLGLNNTFTQDYQSPTNHTSENRVYPFVLAANYRNSGLESDLIVIRNQSNFPKNVHFVDFTKDNYKDALLSKVTQSNGAIVDEITYESMESTTSDLGAPDDFYSSTESLQYPLVELKRIPSNYLVSQIRNTSLGTVKFQKFKYHGYAVNMTGIGALGFIKTARSAWYKGDGSEKILWNVSENDPYKRGASIKSYAQLLGATENFSFANLTNGVINKTENFFSENTDSVSKRYTILLNKKTTEDNLTGIINETTYDSYSTDYYLPLSITTKNFLGSTLEGSKNETIIYENAVTGEGSNYYIGRPSEVTTTVSAYGDTQTSSQKYFYTGGNITRTEKNANSAPETIVETVEYFPNGLVKSKTLSATGTNTQNAVSPRTTSYTYDTTNRFVKTTTDAEGLVTTNNTFHNLYGTVLSQTNPFGQVTTSTYDNWGKPTRITDFLGKSIVYTYTRTGNNYITVQTGDDGSASSSESDALARVIKKGAKDINGNWVYTNTEYDFQGKKTRDSEPYFSTTSPSLWSSYEYDDYGRNIKTTYPTGKIVTTTFNGLTVTANDQIMTKSKTMNANGHVISTTDTPGGTINFKYNASGNLIESDYEGVKITTVYDAWGRRISLTDSSAGTYTTEYNAYGETLKETTPKGTTTIILNPVGKVITKSVVGISNLEKTNITNTYTYDPTYKWITRIDVTNTNDGNSSYEYVYDATTKQLKQTIETLPYAIFTKSLTFDTFGRIDTETTTGVAHGKTSTKTIKYTYKNGVSWQLLDGTNILWQANTFNARGQLTNTTLGNGIDITNSYDNYGYATQFKHTKTGTTPINVMTLNTAFEAVRGNLTSRFSSLFNTNEAFSYDSLDRLIQWSNIGTVSTNFYFNSGVEGFTPYTAAATVTNYNGQLKTVANDYFAGVQKQLLTDAYVGQAIKIKGNFTKISGTGKIVAIVTETNPLTQDSYETIMQTMISGAFELNYTVKYYSNISIRFTIDASALGVQRMGITEKTIRDNSNSKIIDGGEEPGPTTPSATFYLDNIEVSRFTNSNVESQDYDDRGRIIQNNLGIYNYTNTAKPYQQTSVTPLTKEAEGFYQSRGNLSISYNAFKAPVQIEEIGKDKISFAYSGMLERSAMYYGSNDDDRLARPSRRYYSADGSMEVNYNITSGIVEFVTFVGGDAYTAPIVVKSDGTVQNYFYLHRDYQGTMLAVTNSTGTLVEKRHFDAWGNIVKIQDGNGNNLSKLTFLERGYTGHEHLQSVGLIHMNARLYDPKMHRFLQPDNYIQDPYNTQNYNRYGYCVNNPTKYTDVTGNVFGVDDAIIIATSVAIVSYFTINFFNDQPFTLKGVVKSAIIGAISGAVTCGIGSWTEGIKNFFLRASVQALSHGTFQGTMTGIQGGNFWTGFASGALSSIAASAWGGGATNDKTYTVGSFSATFRNQVVKGLGGSFAGSTFGKIVFGSIMGGAGAALTKGNFWQGAVTGAIVAGLNHVLHQTKQEDPLKKHAHKVKHTLEEWEVKYKGMTWREIATEAGWKDGQPLGPIEDWRYIKAPDGRVMDMRHVSIVGYGYGEGIGNTVEHLQNLVPRMRPSAFDPQDYYSNKIGAYFYQLRHSGSWASNSWAHDFKRFIDVHYRTLFSNYKP